MRIAKIAAAFVIFVMVQLTILKVKCFHHYLERFYSHMITEKSFTNIGWKVESVLTKKDRLCGGLVRHLEGSHPSQMW